MSGIIQQVEPDPNLMLRAIIAVCDLPPSMVRDRLLYDLSIIAQPPMYVMPEKPE